MTGSGALIDSGPRKGKRKTSSPTHPPSGCAKLNQIRSANLLSFLCPSSGHGVIS